jgi:hypothetical protein
MGTGQNALNDFLTQHCEIKPIAIGASHKERCYILHTEDCLLFMAENHVAEMRNATGQTQESMALAKKTGDYSKLIMAYNWNAPEPGLDAIRIPLKLVESLDDKRAFIILRNLEGIQKDITEGKIKKEGLQKLFSDTAQIKIFYNLEGERAFLIKSAISSSDKRGYAERYAEHVATNVLFDLPKALNAQLQKIVPKPSRGKFFVEGRDITARKIRYGADAFIELVLSDDGATIYTDLTKKDSTMRASIHKLFKQAMTDPFGFSLKYYMGKHAIIKLTSPKN